MIDSKQRAHYRCFRCDYYHAGRLLHVMSNFHGAGIMLGYAVETTMKAGLVEVLTEEEQNKNKTLTRSHDVGKIFAECKKHGVFTGIDVSDDFLQHVHHHFQRYPSQMRKVLGQTREDIIISSAIGWFHYYDDLIVQLDCALYEMTSDPSVSIFFHAMRSLETPYSRAILRENAHALLRFDDFAAVVRQNMLGSPPDHQRQMEENFSMGINFYYDPDARQVVQIKSVADNYRAGKFKLPKWETISPGHMCSLIRG